MGCLNWGSPYSLDSNNRPNQKVLQNGISNRCVGANGWAVVNYGYGVCSHPLSVKRPFSNILPGQTMGFTSCNNDGLKNMIELFSGEMITGSFPLG